MAIRFRYILLLVIIASITAFLYIQYQQRLLRATESYTIQHDSFSGNYLAGYIASKDGNWDDAADRFTQALKQQPTEHLLERTYSLLLLSGNVEEAITLAHKQADAKTQNHMTIWLRALASFKKGDYTTAAALWQSLLDQKSPNDTTDINAVLVPFLVVWSDVGNKQYDKALAYLSELENDENRAFINFHRALLYDVAGQNAEAEKAYDDSLAGETQPYHFVKAAASFYVRNHENDKAKALYEKYASQEIGTNLFNPDIDQLSENIAPSYPQPTSKDGLSEVILEGVRIAYQNNFYDEALAYLHIVHYIYPEQPESLMLLASDYEDKKNYASANELYSHINAQSYFYYRSQIRAARNLYLMDKKNDGEQRLRQLSEESPKRYDALLTLADLLRGDKKFVKASKLYGEALERIGTPTAKQWYILYAKGICDDQAGHWDEAEKSLQKGLELFPNQPDILNYLGYSWLLQKKHISKAKDMIEHALALRPNDAQIMDSMGWALFHLGDYKEAVLYLEGALEILPGDPVLNDHLGDIYWQLGRRNEARFQWARALKMKPEASEIPTIEHKLKEGLTEVPAAK